MENEQVPKKLEPFANRALVYSILALLFAFLYPVFWYYVLINLDMLEFLGRGLGASCPLAFLFGMFCAAEGFVLACVALFRIWRTPETADGEGRAIAALFLTCTVALAGAGFFSSFFRHM